jgi:capsular exopolysaccharide synthesis family protein
MWAHPVQPDEAHFWDYWTIIVRHRWTVLTFFVVTVIVTTIWTFTTRPVFTGTATLRIEKEEPRVLKFEEVVKTDPQQEYYQTQFKILLSRTLASRVIGLLGLDQHPEFQQFGHESGWVTTAQAWARERLITWVPVPPPPEPQASEDDLALESSMTRAFERRLTVEPVRNARLVKVGFESYYPDLAARVANTLAEAFIAQQLDQKVETTRYATQFLAKQMEEARGKLETAEGKLNRFLGTKDILFVGSPDRVGERQDLVIQQLGVLSDALLKARNERIAKESVVHQALSQEAASLPAVLQSPLIAKLKEELVSQEGEYRKLSQRFKPEYPRMQRVEGNIAELKRQLQGEINRVVAGLDVDYQAALRSERELEKTVTEHRHLARQLDEKMAEYRLLHRDVDTNRELYTALLTRLKETQVSSSLVTSNISIVDRAEVPLTPSRPPKALHLLLGSVIGLFGGVGLAFLFEYLDTSIKDAKQVEKVLRVPTIGVVPSQQSLDGWRARQRRRLAEDNGDSGPFALVAYAEMESGLAEVFRNLRTSLLYSAPDHPPKTLMVTSLHPGDGKTSLATNLSITLSQLGAGEILLVDGDMRRPTLHDLLEVPQAPGLSTFLTGQAELPAVLKRTKIPNLYVIPAGRIPLNPAELMASARLRQMLDVLGERFNHIVFDAPPLIGVSDAVILAPRIDGVVLVLRHGRAGRDASQRAIQLLASVRARLLGVVLNDVDVSQTGSGYYGQYGYYGYGVR